MKTPNFIQIDFLRLISDLKENKISTDTAFSALLSPLFSSYYLNEKKDNNFEHTWNYFLNIIQNIRPKLYNRIAFMLSD